jgi:hypothetical protein
MGLACSTLGRGDKNLKEKDQEVEVRIILK